MIENGYKKTVLRCSMVRRVLSVTKKSSENNFWARKLYIPVARMLQKLASPLIAALALSQSVLSFPLTRRLDNGAPLRNVQYVQTFTDPSGNWFNLTDLVTQNTGLTHLILASLHLDNPTEIHLNDNDIEGAYWDPLWPMVSSLQDAGVKVMLMMGGAARGSYANLQNDVRLPSSCFQYIMLTNAVRHILPHHPINSPEPQPRRFRHGRRRKRLRVRSAQTRPTTRCRHGHRFHLNRRASGSIHVQRRESG